MATIARGLVIGALTPMLLAAACTPEPVAPASPSPSVSASPSETDAERQMRLDWEAAEKAYRDGVAEFARLAMAGGASAPTAELKRVSTGRYLDLQMSGLRLLKRRKWKMVQDATIVAVRPAGGWKQAALALKACEANDTLEFSDRSDSDVTPRLADYVQSLTIVKASGQWRVADVRTRSVEKVSESDCA